ncbi:MAG: alpha/beta hydrolase, partial [Candidatus Spyradosoma sp.]
RPMLFVVGERAMSAYFSEDAHARAAEPKELFVVPGATHVDLYDNAEFQKISLSEIEAFFRTAL